MNIRIRHICVAETTVHFLLASLEPSGHAVVRSHHDYKTIYPAQFGRGNRLCR